MTTRPPRRRTPTTTHRARRRGPDPDAPAVRICGPADAAAAVPYLLGFHPAASLVLLGLGDTGRVVVTARTDLADVAASAELVGGTLAAMARGGARRLIALVFDEPPRPPRGTVTARRELPWDGLADEVIAAASAAGLRVDEVGLVGDQRLWSYVCDVAACCPPEGRPLQSSAAPAELTFAGLVALPDRAALAATLDPLPDAERDLLLDALGGARAPTLPLEPPAATPPDDGLFGSDDLHDRHPADPAPPPPSPSPGRSDRAVVRALFAASRDTDRAGSVTALDRTELVDFGAALRRRRVRDAVWLAIDDGRLDGRLLWRELGRRLPSPYDATPLFLFAWASYREGNGALAGIAAERALASDPGCSAANLVLGALGSAIDPRELPRLRRRSA